MFYFKFSRLSYYSDTVLLHAVNLEIILANCHFAGSVWICFDAINERVYFGSHPKSRHGHTNANDGHPRRGHLSHCRLCDNGWTVTQNCPHFSLHWYRTDRKRRINFCLYWENTILLVELKVGKVPPFPSSHLVLQELWPALDQCINISAYWCVVSQGQPQALLYKKPGLGQALTLGCG